MNIIKLKDILMPGDTLESNYFNKHLKGKYAYWVQMRYIVSFDHMRHEGYVACEEDITKLLQKEDGTYPKPYGAPSIDVYKDGIIYYVDSVETDNINNTIGYRMKNKYTSDSDITIDEIKMFRTWLATELLKMDQTELGEQKNSYFDDLETHVLNYYTNEMYDSTIRILSELGSSHVTFNKLVDNSCGCQSSDLSSLHQDSLVVCDSVSIYRKNIYNKMVSMYSNIDFWTQWSSEFINEMKKYVDNIINLNLPLNQSSNSNTYLECGCKKDDEQNILIDILKRLSISLGYIADNQIISHKNYISDALTDWSSMLYENMRW